MLHPAGDRARGDDDHVDAGAVQRGDLLEIRATTESRSSPPSSATIDDPSLTTATGIGGSLERRAGIELEDDPGDLDVVAGLESLPSRARRSRPCAAAGARRGPAPPRSRGRGGRPGARRRRRSTRNSARARRVDLERRCARPGRKTWNSATSLSPATSSEAGSATGTRRSSSRAELVEPLPRRARGDEHGHVDPLAPLGGGRLGRLGRDEVGLREREDARELGQPRVVLGELGLDHAVVLERVGAVQRREVEHVDEQPRALDVGEEVVAEPGAGARRPRSAPGCRR